MIVANALQLPYADRSAHAAVTSPPYLAKRRYVGVEPCEWPAVTYRPMPGLPEVEVPAVGAGAGDAGILGLEPDPLAYIGHLVLVFREARRVLRDDGVLCVNIGDSYSAGGNDSGLGNGKTYQKKTTTFGGVRDGVSLKQPRKPSPGLKPKDLMGVPWRLAFALQADGWYLRSRMPGGVETDLVPEAVELRPDVIWTKNAMPESVRDRPSVDFEDVFIFSKSRRYCWDQENGRMAGSSPPARRDPGNGASFTDASGYKPNSGGLASIAGANMRASWKINTEATSEEHYAAWPRELVRRLIRVGTSDKGCCRECGAQMLRQVERHPAGVRRDPGGGDSMTDLGMYAGRAGEIAAQTTGWQHSCSCDSGDPVPCSVLDPFSGIGRTGQVCYETGRRYMPAELSVGYAGIQKSRLAGHVAVAVGEGLPARKAQTISGPLFENS